MKQAYGWSLGVLALFVATVFMQGCSQNWPSANVSDFAVYTSLHLVAAEAAQSRPTTMEVSALWPLTSHDMYRYFRSTTREYADHQERMDMFLDGTQQRSAFTQALETSLNLNLMANLLSAATQPAATQPATTQFVAAATQAVAALDKSSEDTTQPIIDSPFDQLDRVADFYMTYAIKALRQRGDSRAIDPQALKYLLRRYISQESPSDLSTFDDLATQPSDSQARQDCQLLLAFQVHVAPGAVANMMTGVRLHVIGVSPSCFNLDDVKVISLHPSRTYDIDAGSFNQSETTALSIAAQLSGKAGVAGISGSAGFGGAEADEERSEYTSRINKDASFADAPQHMYGFDFYPSNVVVHPRGWLLQILTGRTYQADGYLEPGGRDCSLRVMVPRGLDSVTFGVTYVSGDIGYTEGGLAGLNAIQWPIWNYWRDKDGVQHGLFDKTHPRDWANCENFTVTLPKWSCLEETASSLTAAPFFINTPPATTQPSGSSGKSQADK